MATIFLDKRILLGVTGSIAAYKSADLASKLTQEGAVVDVILTPAATQFITPLTFQSVTGQRAYCDSDLWGREGHVIHIGLGRNAEILVVAPTSANTLAKLSHGIADNLLTLTALTVNCPVIIAPAMDGDMYNHPATQSNLDILHDRGVISVGPLEGHLASGQVGIGRMAEPSELLGYIRLVLGRAGDLNGRNIVVTAGGTQEPIDPVRFIANRSSGKQGYALAQAALDRGAQVTLITAPTHLSTPIGAHRVEVCTAEEMRKAVLEAVAEADALLMAAAVADFRPSGPALHKLKRKAGIPQIKLEATPDILAAVAELKKISNHPKIIVGFAAESKNLLENAHAKLDALKLDLVVANDITASDAGFAAETNRVTLIDAGGEVKALPLMSKANVADSVLARVVSLLAS